MYVELHVAQSVKWFKIMIDGSFIQIQSKQSQARWKVSNKIDLLFSRKVGSFNNHILSC